VRIHLRVEMLEGTEHEVPHELHFVLDVGGCGESSLQAGGHRGVRGERLGELLVREKEVGVDGVGIEGWREAKREVGEVDPRGAVGLWGHVGAGSFSDGYYGGSARVRQFGGWIVKNV
jgi:hypothetical protein